MYVVYVYIYMYTVFICSIQYIHYVPDLAVKIWTNQPNEDKCLHVWYMLGVSARPTSRQIIKDQASSSNLSNENAVFGRSSSTLICLLFSVTVLTIMILQRVRFII